jgi:hypothetical protein
LSGSLGNSNSADIFALTDTIIREVNNLIRESIYDFESGWRQSASIEAGVQIVLAACVIFLLPQKYLGAMGNYKTGSVAAVAEVSTRKTVIWNELRTSRLRFFGMLLLCFITTIGSSMDLLWGVEQQVKLVDSSGASRYIVLCSFATHS